MDFELENFLNDDGVIQVNSHKYTLSKGRNYEHHEVLFVVIDHRLN